MAFVETARWQAAAHYERPKSSLVWPRWIGTKNARRAVAVALTIAVHLLVATLLMTLWKDPQSASTQERNSLTLITLAPPGMMADAPPEQKPAAAIAAADVPAQPPIVPQPPVEWSMQKMRVAMASPAPSPALNPAPPAASPSAGTAGAGPGGEGAYDPYAGASPRRLGASERTLLGNAGTMPPPANGQGGAPSDTILAIWDKPIVIAVKRVTERRFPQAKGIIVMTVRVAPGQARASIEKVDGAVDPAALRLIERLLSHPSVRPELRDRGFVATVTLNL